MNNKKLALNWKEWSEGERSGVFADTAIGAVGIIRFAFVDVADLTKEVSPPRYLVNSPITLDMPAAFDSALEAQLAVEKALLAKTKQLVAQLTPKEDTHE